MSKYPLLVFLRSQGESFLKLSIAEIERILGTPPLSASARNCSASWANERATAHQHALAWLDAGYETSRLNLNAGTVEFVRSSSAKSRQRT